ncbi:MAG: sigma-70 family RNA polymerase sigma factor [Acidimicrobiia bacterium]
MNSTDQIEEELRSCFPDYGGDYRILAELVLAQCLDGHYTGGRHRDRIGRQWVSHFVVLPRSETSDDQRSERRVGTWKRKNRADIYFEDLAGCWYLSSGPPSTNGEYDRARELIKSLNDDEQELIELLYFDRLPQREIAARLGCSQTTVHRRHRRVLGRLRGEVVG